MNPFTIPLGLNGIEVVNIDGAPGFIVPPVTLDVLNADSIDTINFRAPINNVTVNNLSTALVALGLSDDVFGNTFTVNHIGTATDGTDDSLAVNLQNNAGGSAIVLAHAGGGADQGYESIAINSTGGLGNNVTIASSHGPSTLTIEGTANLNLGTSGILNVATLDTVEAGTFTGDLTATFTGTGDVDVNSGSGDDMLSFLTTGNVAVDGADGDDTLTFGAGVVATATGGNGDDNFTFLALGNGNSSFTTADTVDGEEGDDSLTIFHTGAGAFLAAGVGAGIVGIETIIHDGDIANAGNNLTVDMAESGSAKTLRLQGSYDLGITTTINNLMNDDLVILDGENQWGPTGNLVLNYAAPGALNILNLELAGGQVTNLATMSLTEVTNITSSGATANTVENASGVEGNVVILGATDLTFGTSPANFYDFTNGVIDASGFTGDLTVGIESGLLAANISVIGGTGDDYIVVNGASIAGGFAATIDLSVGGADTVLFNNAAVFLNNHGLVGDIHHVVGFELDDKILFDEDGSGTPLTSTTGIAITTDFATQFGANFFALDVAAGTNQDGTAANYVFIKFTTAVDTAGDNAVTAFHEAIGLGSISVAAGAADVLASYYDSTNSQMVLFTIDVDSHNAGGNVITQDDDIDVIATVGMSAADYAAFGFANLDVVA